ncbi:MAG: hypothetical protein ACYTG0_39150 [Planctomycetota bacterium]|jgi:hypothetical protein
MQELADVAVPGIAAYLLIREVFTFVRWKRNGNGKNCHTQQVQSESADKVSRHDQLLSGEMGVVNELRQIEKRLSKIEDAITHRDI